MYYNVCVLLFVIVCVYVCLFLGTTLYRHFSLLWNPSLGKIDNNNNNNNNNKRKWLASYLVATSGNS